MVISHPYLILFFFILTPGVTADKLLQAQILFRHGARNQVFPNWNYLEYEDIMQYLTPVGIRQHYILGSWLRSRYIENTDTSLNILKPQLDQNEIFIRSTDVNRTIQSALSNLYGLYPPGSGYTLPDNVPTDKFLPPNSGVQEPQIGKNQITQIQKGLNSTPYLFQPVPIHMVPQQQDYLLLSDSSACPNQINFLINNLQTELYQRVNDANIPLFQQYGKETEMTDEQIAEMSLPFIVTEQDSKIVYEWNGYPFPHELSPDLQKKMQDLYPLILNLVYFQTWEEVSLLSTPFFQEILQNMENKLDGTQSFKSYNFHMYSGHDTTIQLILNGLQLTSTECIYQAWNKSEITNKNCIYTYPGFASNVIFELWKDTQNVPYVKIMNNGSYVPPCVNSQSESCSFDQFKKQLTAQFQDYFSGCGIQTNQTVTETKVPNWAWFLLTLFGILFVLSLFFGIYSYQRWKNSGKRNGFTQQFNSDINQINY